MFELIFVLFLLISLNFAANPCTKEGEVSRTLTASYKCTNGRLAPTGCLTKSGLSIGIDETAPSGHIISKCQKSSDDTISMVPIGCNINDHDLKPNEEYNDQNYVYGCTSKSDGTLVFETKGCIGASGEKVPLGGTVTKRNFLYKCTGNSTFVTLEPYKCLLNGKQYSIGDTPNDGNFWSLCEKSGSAMILTLKGCVDQNGKQINPGEQFRTRDYIMKCVQNGNGMGKNVIGCVENKPQNATVDHYPGEKWLEPAANGNNQASIVVKYLLECVQSNDQVGQNYVRCYFEGKSLDGGTYVDPGCMKKFGKLLLKCKSGENSLSANYVQNAGTKDQTNAQNDGLKFC